jgi:hypothetical protein
VPIGAATSLPTNKTGNATPMTVRTVMERIRFVCGLVFLPQVQRA